MQEKPIQLSVDSRVVRRLLAEGADLSPENLAAVSRQIEREEECVVYRVYRDAEGLVTHIIARRMGKEELEDDLKTD